MPDRHPETDDLACPAPCSWCDEEGPGACEDCLVCLCWPHPVPGRQVVAAPVPGPTSPVLADVLAVQRARLTLGQRIGLTLRRHRRALRHSQREAAREIGWSRSALARAEVDARALPLHKVEWLLAVTGHRLAIVPDTGEPAADIGEEDDTAWGVPDLVARDAGRRRLPACGDVRFRSSTERLADGRRTGHEGPWVWTRPQHPDGTARGSRSGEVSPPGT